MAKLEAIVQRVTEVQARTTSLEAAFEQRKTSRLLAVPSVSAGRFYFKAPDQVRWEYATPRPMSVLVGHGVALTYRPAEKRAERVELGRLQRRIFRFLGAAEPLDQLRRHFAFTLRDAGGGSNYVLTLDPASAQLKRRLRQVVIEIERASFLPVAVSFAEPDGDATEYVFRDVRRNGAIAEDLFEIQLPRDVEVVEMKLRSAE